MKRGSWCAPHDERSNDAEDLALGERLVEAVRHADAARRLGEDEVEAVVITVVDRLRIGRQIAA